MSILSQIQNCAETTFKINILKPYQLLVIHRIVEQFETVEEENQIVVLPTGSGKSLCFLIPAVICKKITIIVYPLLALMNDQAEKLKNNNIDCVNLRGGQTKEERIKIFKKIENGTKIIITNPETLNQKNIINRLKKYDIEMLIIDEAHVISQWGKSFRPAYLDLKSTIKEINPHQIIAFTATVTKQTIEDITSCLFVKEPLLVQSDADRDNIFYASYPVNSKNQGLIDLLKTSTRPAIVFCSRRELTYHLAMMIKRFYPSYPVGYYHAGLTKEERLKIENWFRKTDNAVLVTTCAYGLGVDIPGIRTIIHYDLPEDALEYLQESGRAGRDGKSAIAWVLVPFNKENSGLIHIFRENTCRRQALLEELGEHKEECSGCDVCTKQVIAFPHGHKVIRAFVKLYPFKYSSTLASRILTGDPFCYQYRMHPFYGVLDTDSQLIKESIGAMGFQTVNFLKHRDVLYIDNKLNNLIARILRRI